MAESVPLSPLHPRPAGLPLCVMCVSPKTSMFPETVSRRENKLSCPVTGTEMRHGMALRAGLRGRMSSFSWTTEASGRRQLSLLIRGETLPLYHVQSRRQITCRKDVKVEATGQSPWTQKRSSHGYLDRRMHQASKAFRLPGGETAPTPLSPLPLPPKKRSRWRNQSCFCDVECPQRLLVSCPGR